MFKKILLVAAVVVIVFLIVVAFQPAEFRVTRSVTIAAPPAAVFAQVNELKKWDAWSPWAKLDPNAKNTFEGPPAGVGSAMSWAGNSEVGVGKMTITESRASELVRFKLDFLKPFEASNTSEFTFKTEGAQTFVTWSMEGKNNFLFKAVGLFMNCDKMLGPQFEKGLAQLKSTVEAGPKP